MLERFVKNDIFLYRIFFNSANKIKYKILKLAGFNIC